MSKVSAELSRIVDEDISGRITQYDVLYEAITNSIHANATLITCKLNSNDKLLDENGKTLRLPKLDNIIIEDNGDGLNEANFASFCKYRSDYKKSLGCKGVGRLAFLKLYKSAIYKSDIANEQLERSFIFTTDFDTEDDVSKLPKKVKDNFTEISLNDLRLQYLNAEKGVDRRISIDLDIIKEKVLLHLIPTLFFYKKKGVEIVIRLVDNTTGGIKSITSNDIPNFETKPIKIRSNEGIEYDFILNYLIEDTYGKLYAYYCANNRTVCEFSEKDLKISLPNNYSGFFLFESDYFNSHVNNERNDFDIFPIRTDFVSPLSWEIINTGLKNQISDVVKHNIPETQEINQQKLKSIQEERPYLINYINTEDLEMAGFLDKKDIIDKAKKRFDTAKEHFLENSGKSSYTKKDLDEAIQITQNELVSYIFDRVQVVERLRTMFNNQEQVESIIHNLFMQKYTDDNYFTIGKNNLWLIDDRFTTYTYAASDKRIKDVLANNGETVEIENGDDKPDLSLFFSHSPSNAAGLKSVIVEIKPFDYKNKSDKKKHQGVQQLVDYVKAFQKSENIEEVWAFLITDIDTKLADRLRGDDYTPLFSTKTPMYHRFYKELGISIYVLSAETLIFDAEARNKVFLDIIKKQSRLNQVLNGNSNLPKPKQSN